MEQASSRLDMESYGKSIYGRVERLLGEDLMSVLASTRVIVFGIGGVGSWCAEGLLRSGIVNITIVDSDNVSPTNVNRQVMATSETIGVPKVDAMKDHLLRINPEAEISAIQKVYDENSEDEFDLDSYDYVIDAIDSLKDKIRLILNASSSSAHFFCSLGAALKVNPRKVRVDEFWSVRGCPLGAAIRKKMKRAKTLPASPFLCVYDDEVLPNLGGEALMDPDPTFKKAQVNGSLAHMTSIFGMTLAGLVIEDICQRHGIINA